MRAIVIDKKLKFNTEYPAPVPKKGESLVKILAAGICNTDIELMRGYMDFKGVLGHEFVGVVKKSDSVELVGKRVVGEININCGKCYFCRNNMGRHCPTRSVLGILKRDGAFAEYMTIPNGNLHVLPGEVSVMDAVFVEPLAAAFEILEQVHIKPTDKVVVFGDGRLGLLCAKVIALATDRITVVGKHSEKLDILKNMDMRTRYVEEFKPHNSKANIVVDCTGSRKGLVMAMHTVMPRGKLIIKSTTKESGGLDLNHMVINEITVIGSRCGPFSAAIGALAWNRVDVKPLITNKCKLEDGVEALKALSKKSQGIKTVITMD